MNAQKYLRSQLGKTIERIKRAYLSDKHICVLVCSEPDFIKAIVEMASVLPNHFQVGGTDINNGKNDGTVKFVCYDSQKKDAMLIFSKTNESSKYMEHLFVYQYLIGEYANKNLTESIELPLADLMNYVNIYSGLEQANREVNRDKLYLLKSSLILILAKSVPQIPAYIEPYTEIVIPPCMEEAEFNEIVSVFLEDTEGIPTAVDATGYRMIADKEYLKILYHNMRSLNATQIVAALKMNQKLLGHVYFNKDTAPSYEENMEQLRQNLRSEFEKVIGCSRALSLEEPLDNVPAGLDNMGKWLKSHKEYVARPYNQSQYGMSAPKGLIVSGIPGSGKSMMAKYVAKEFGLSLIKFDFGNLGGKYVGESEKNMDEALGMIETLSPCVLWVDEMEKAFPKNNGAKENEVTERLFGKFLTWMQERERRGVSCFVFATANDISQMPPELFRSGRFDDKFFTFMPTADECAAIFSSIIRHQTKRKQKNLQEKPLFNTRAINGALFKSILEDHAICLSGELVDRQDKSVNRLNKFFTGADIEQLISNAKRLYLNRYGEVGRDKEKESGDWDCSIASSNDVVFDTARFKACLIQAIGDMKTYGETNLVDIARCYAQLAKNNFKSASMNTLLPFKGYDELECLAIGADRMNENTLLYQLEGENEHFASLRSRYDKCMYLIIRNTINKMAKVILKEELR